MCVHNGIGSVWREVIQAGELLSVSIAKPISQCQSFHIPHGTTRWGECAAWAMLLCVDQGIREREVLIHSFRGVFFSHGCRTRRERQSGRIPPSRPPFLIIHARAPQPAGGRSLGHPVPAGNRPANSTTLPRLHPELCQHSVDDDQRSSGLEGEGARACQALAPPGIPEPYGLIHCT